MFLIKIFFLYPSLYRFGDILHHYKVYNILTLMLFIVDREEMSDYVKYVGATGAVTLGVAAAAGAYYLSKGSKPFADRSLLDQQSYEVPVSCSTELQCDMVLKIFGFQNVF